MARRWQGEAFRRLALETPCALASLSTRTVAMAQGSCTVTALEETLAPGSDGDRAMILAVKLAAPLRTHHFARRGAEANVWQALPDELNDTA